VPSHGDRPGTITSSLELQPATGDAIGALEEQFAFAAGEREVTIDASITILADCGVALRMGDTEDGGFGIRLREEFRQDRGAVLMNAEGARGTENIWGKPSRWVCYSASVEGAPASVVMMDHPANLRYPTRWHARGYGLCSANPFALRDFTGEARADGSHTIPAGGRLQLRYRVVIHEGEALGVAEAERMHRAFAS
jgi:hypothetical protein